jgi:ABC-type amino acid transport system permease subunit
MPSVTNEVITLVKDTSLAFTLAYQEVFSLAKQISASQTSFMPFLIAGIFYFVANYVVEIVMNRIEKSMDYYK